MIHHICRTQAEFIPQKKYSQRHLSKMTSHFIFKNANCIKPLTLHNQNPKNGAIYFAKLQA